MAFSIKCIYDTNGLVVGGFSGIAIIVRSITEKFIVGGIPLWLTNLILNIPVFFVGYFVLGKKFIGRTIIATCMISFWLLVLPFVDFTQGDFVLSAVFGGAISGAGIGLVLLAKATTGGTDMVAAIIQKYMRHRSVVQIMVCLDVIIIAFGCIQFGMGATLYAIVAIFVTSEVSDALLEGLKYAKAVFIISDKSDEIATILMETLSRGVTGIEAVGKYSNQKKEMLYCVVSKKEIVMLKDIISGVDSQAFVIVTDAREVLGEGFLEY